MTAKSQTYGVVLGVRGFQSAAGTAQAVSLMKTTRIYPLKQIANPPANVFISGSGKEIDTVYSDSGQYFADLAWMIEREPHEAIPSHERFQLAAIGIEKGKPFTPDATRKALFDEAARFAAAIARTNSPDAPTGSGSHAKNWLQTTPGKGWFTIFRFYGPLEPFFDQTWKPDDIAKVK